MSTSYNLSSNPILPAKWKSFVRNPLRFIKSRTLDGIYWMKRLFNPYNVVRCNDLPKSWVDRDELMFHAMFQILVDFVELEHPFRNFDDNSFNGRYTDISSMKKWLEDHYNTDEGRAGFYANWFSEEEKKQQDLSTAKTYQIYSEILYLYEWYKNKKYDLDELAIHEKTGTKTVFNGGRLTTVPNKQPALITKEECFELIQEHKTVRDVMLYRILSIREYLWT